MGGVRCARRNSERQRDLRLVGYAPRSPAAMPPSETRTARRRQPQAHGCSHARSRTRSDPPRRHTPSTKKCRCRACQRLSKMFFDRYFSGRARVELFGSQSLTRLKHCLGIHRQARPPRGRPRRVGGLPQARWQARQTGPSSGRLGFAGINPHPVDPEQNHAGGRSPEFH
jgi:hypothetical protein